MSEETFMLCDGEDCSATVKSEVAISERWYHGQFIEHAEDPDRFDVDLCPICVKRLFPDLAD